jgi:hypothetical protein
VNATLKDARFRDHDQVNVVTLHDKTHDHSPESGHSESAHDDKLKGENAYAVRYTYSKNVSTSSPQQERIF